MKPRFIHTLVFAILLASSRMMAEEPTNSVAAAQPTNGVVRLDLPSFQIVSQRNIFDPNRRPRSSSNSGPRVRPTQVDTFSLRGTMSYGNQSVAFFDGSSSQYSKAVTSKDTIAGYKIAEIAFDHVKLAAASNQTINLPIGSQMKRQDNGPWALVENPEPAAEPTAPAASDKPATPASGGGAADDVIKRLMQKREREK
jgi:hypothetical protein